jgi:methionyl-tRNA formyltransferase
MEAISLQSNMRYAPISVVFFGTPGYAVPSLRALHEDSRYEVALVITQPDRPAGRRHRLTAPPVKIVADELGLHTYQPGTLRNAEAREPLVAANADVFVVAAYGLIFGGKTLSIPRHGCVNLHASLLPKYRGASPIAAAILEGEQRTGVTLMLMDSGIDTGQILDSASIEIDPMETTESLTARLGVVGANLVRTRLADYVRGDLKSMPQPSEGASATRMLGRTDGWIDWNRPAILVERQVRAMWPWPRAWTLAGDRSIQIHSARVVEGRAGSRPGEVHTLAGSPIVSCGSGGLMLEVVQPAAGRAVSGAAWLAGLRGDAPVLGGDQVVIPGAPLVVEA